MAPASQPPPVFHPEMSLIDLMAEMAVSDECRFCDKCGQKLKDKIEDEKGLIDFEGEMTFSRSELKDFNAFFRSTRQEQTLLQIFTPEEIAATCGEIEAVVWEEDLLCTSVPSERLKEDLLAPVRLKVPALDLLTGLELGLALPKAEPIEPSGYVPQPPVGLLIEIEEKVDPLPWDEVEDILQFLFPERDVPSTPSPIEEESAIPSEYARPEVPTAPVQAPKKKRKRNRKKATVAPEPTIETPKPAVETPKPTVKTPEPIAETPESIVEIPKSVVEVEVIPEPPSKSPTEPARLTPSMMPRRRDLSKAGEVGKKVEVFVNMLAINFDENLPAQVERYSVNYEPSSPKSLIKKAYAAVKDQLFPELNPAYDGNGQLISAGSLPIETPFQLSVKVRHREDDTEDTEVLVTIAKVKETEDQNVDLSWMREVQASWTKDRKYSGAVTALRLILHSVVANKGIKGKRFYFVRPEDGKAISIGDGLEMWHGLFQSITIGWKTLLKVDVAHRSFFKTVNVIDYIESIFDHPSKIINFDLLKTNWAWINEKLTNLQVTIEFNNEKRSQQLILGLTDKKPHDIVFPNDDGEMISVHKFFLGKGYVIRYPDLPCLKIASTGNILFVPMELCKIDSDQPVRSKMSESQKDVVDSAAAIDASERRCKIFDVLNEFYKDDSCLESFGLKVNREFEKVVARVLDPPTLYFKDGAEVKPEKGVWMVEPFLCPTSRLQPNGSWTIMNLSNVKMNEIKKFVHKFEVVAMGHGVRVGESRQPFINLPSIVNPNFIAESFGIMKFAGIQLVIVVIPDRCKKLYCTIKQIAELNVGILTQCVRNTTIECGLDDEVMRNITMKVNAKLGGINYSFIWGINRPQNLCPPCIIVGADVTHPSTKSEPSIAAVVASHDPNSQFQYSATLRFQPPNVEIMNDLQAMMRELLINFYHRNAGLKPSKIMYYRDGVGEGDFAKVMNTELLAIKQACTSLEQDYHPQITFMIVQKRINTRLFPTTNETDPVEVGTIVDTVITHPTDIDFVLVSHPTEDGEARPTKYRCLWDDAEMSIDDIEQLTYSLCHMFAKSSQCAKYPAPTYYAHLAAARARHLTEGVSIDLTDLAKEQEKLKLHADLATYSPMYFL